MIARIWKGWTLKENANNYETLLKTTIFPSFTKIEGYLGGSIFREVEEGQEVAFLITSYFTSMEAVKAFAGEDYTVAVIEPEARALLIKVDSHAKHFEVRENFQVTD